MLCQSLIKIDGERMILDQLSNFHIIQPKYAHTICRHEGRKFLLQSINKYVLKGSGSSSLEDIVQEETAGLLDNFKDSISCAKGDATVK